MTLISLRTREGAYWTAVDGGISLTAEPTLASLFVEEDAALRCANGGWITLKDGALAIDENPPVRMSIVRGDQNDAAVRVADGSLYVSASAGVLRATATEIGSAETFTLDAHELRSHGCCGYRSEEGHILWETYSHEIIVRKGAELLAKETRVENARIFSTRFWSHKKFVEELNRGLIDADYRRPWVDPHITDEYNFFAYHFCHPDTMETLRAVRTITPFFQKHNAVSEGQRYFNLALHVARRILRLGEQAPDHLFETAGHYLGLSLHFLTDLTQPMHAVNFANIVGEDRLIPQLPFKDFRHAQFEKYTDAWIKAGNLHVAAYKPYEYSDEGLKRWLNSTELLLKAARDAKSVWDGKLRAITVSKEPNDEPWGKEADESLAMALTTAPAQAARFMAYWIWLARQDLEESAGIASEHWYWLVEPTKYEKLTERDDYIRRVDTSETADQMFILYNADGTCSFGTRSNPGKAWRSWNEGKIFIRPRDPGHKDSKLRLVPIQMNEIWIYNNARLLSDLVSGDHALSVYIEEKGDAGMWPAESGTARLRRNEETQIFQFSGSNHRMTEDEKTAIRKAHGQDVFDIPWWGRPSDASATWHAWENVGKLPAGNLTSLTVTSPGSGLLDICAVIDAATWRLRWIGIWWDWEQIDAPPPDEAAALDLSGIGDPPAGTTFSTPLAAATWGGERIDTFAVDSEGNLWQKTYQ